jgi:hypothetical protein
MRTAPGPAAWADLAIAQIAQRVGMGFRHPRLAAPGVVDHAAACPRNRPSGSSTGREGREASLGYGMVTAF